MAVAVVLPDRLEGVAVGRVRVDGLDATEAIEGLVRSLDQFDGARVLLLDGIAFGGFNLVDLPRLGRRVDLPVLAVTPRAPDLPRIEAALRKYFAGSYARRRRRVRLARTRRVVGPGGPLWVAGVGVPREQVAPLLDRAVRRGRWPEALTLAHRIARAVAGAVAARPRARPGPPPRAPKRISRRGRESLPGP